MTREQLEEYLDEVNAKAEPFVPLVTCYACGKPIEDECVIMTRFEPPRWYHQECDPFPPEEPGWDVKRKA